jgi:hypothetical protein
LESSTSSLETGGEQEELNLSHLEKSTQEKVRTILNRRASMWRGEFGDCGTLTSRAHAREEGL